MLKFCYNDAMKKTVIGILAHVDAGKTTLSECLLYKSEVISGMGRVDSKSTYLDTDAMEKERGITIYSKSARLKLGDFDAVLIDTPGHVDFSAEMERTLAVLDVAILLISAKDKVTGHTKTLWKLLKSHKIPTFIFVNKTDLPDVDKNAVLCKLKQELSSDIHDFSTSNNDEDNASDIFYEEIATSSEALLQEYFDTDSISNESIKKAVRNREIFPCMFGSALQDRGIDEFIRVLSSYMPNSLESDTFGALVYKITRDKSGVRLTHLKITGGTFKVKDMLGEEKVNELRLYSGDRYEAVREVSTGDIVAVPGLVNSKPGLCYGKTVTTLMPSLEPVLVYALKFNDKVDITKALSIMRELEEEEPGLHVEYDELLKEIHVCLMGEVQTEVLTRRLKDDYDVDVSFGQGKISYRETITNVVEGVGHFEPLRHYAEVHLKLEPLEQGSGLEFDSEADLDELAVNWQRLVLTHLKEREHRGVLTGSPITDMKITLMSGKAHIKHTEGGDFRQATYRAVRQGLMQAENVLLEPYYDFTLEIPESQVGKAMTDLDRMSCTATVEENVNGIAVLNGSGPVATLNGYAKDVMAYTRGLGHVSLSVSGYRKCHNPEEVIEKIGYKAENDIRNTADSVFCSHGAGVVVPWNDVPDYMHLPFALGGTGRSAEAGINLPTGGSTEERERFISTEEIDEIIGKVGGTNSKKPNVSYKGIPASIKEKQRIGGHREEKEPVYKGTLHKEKYMLIDGYNVVYAWPELRELAASDISGAAGKLIDIVSNYQALTGYNTILVFDAYKIPGHLREEINYNNIKVIYTKTAETADRYIERYAHENGKKYDVTVVTSDGAQQIIIRGGGCTLMSSKDFEQEVGRALLDMRSHKNVWQEN